MMGSITTQAGWIHGASSEHAIFFFLFSFLFVLFPPLSMGGKATAMIWKAAS